MHTEASLNVLRANIASLQSELGTVERVIDTYEGMLRHNPKDFDLLARLSLWVAEKGTLTNYIEALTLDITEG